MNEHIRMTLNFTYALEHAGGDDVYFCGGIVCTEGAPGAVPSARIGADN